MVYQNLTELIGGTPLMELCHYEKELGLHARILAKLELFNPAGSAKDRVGLHMILDAEEKACCSPEPRLLNPLPAIPASALRRWRRQKAIERFLPCRRP